MKSRSGRASLAKTTLQVMDVGRYVNPQGESVAIAAEMGACKAGSEFFEPGQLEQLRDEVAAVPCPFEETRFELANETTLEGSRALAAAEETGRIGVLNFASAKNPGGGFLGGSQAQEESLARSSALYGSLNLFHEEYYETHRKLRDAFYSDRMIYSPGCPVFRDDAGSFLDDSYQVDFLTSAAPNAGAIQKQRPLMVAEIPGIFQRRMDKVLALFAAKGCDTLVLGAWGCGVFRNCPQMVAASFAEFLKPGGSYHGRFRRVRFSVLDRTETQPIYGAFAECFAAANCHE
ncbi:hypothetical protein Pan241w_22540 [Gimesia alba]|uniref:Microbial-type PARG catalytic domain-containing protein n=1 Tax=Gimesia alba TaxID=2527973 RepID=A0A517RE79_9PLAN|nr:TIGR02452 family protein [Gimesia alba]QDT42173.1 hypothetical protein Pan241w_22540 [Gimesia alba]